MRKSIFSTFLVFFISSLLLAGCGKDNEEYNPKIKRVTSTNNPASKNNYKQNNKPEKNKYVKPQKDIENENQDTLKPMVQEALKWVEVKNAIDVTVREIFTDYFKNNRRFRDFKAGQNIKEILLLLKLSEKLPKLKYFQYKDLTLLKFDKKSAKLKFYVRANGKIFQPKSGELSLEVSVKNRMLTLPLTVKKVFLSAAKRTDCDELKWLEATEILETYNIAFMNYLSSNPDISELEKIKTPMVLSKLGRRISLRQDVFSDVRFFTSRDFILDKFNPVTKSYELKAISKGYNPTPRAGSKTIKTIINWLDDVEEPVVETDDDDADDEETVPDNEKPIKPPKKFVRLPSIEGKKVLLKFNYSKEISHEHMSSKVPELPTEFIQELKKVLTEKGAIIVEKSADAEVNFIIKHKIIFASFMDEIFNVRIISDISLHNQFGEQSNSQKTSFVRRYKKIETCFKDAIESAVDKFKQMIKYCFK